MTVTEVLVDLPPYGRVWIRLATKSIPDHLVLREIRKGMQAGRYAGWRTVRQLYQSMTPPSHQKTLKHQTGTQETDPSPSQPKTT